MRRGRHSERARLERGGRGGGGGPGELVRDGRERTVEDRELRKRRRGRRDALARGERVRGGLREGVRVDEAVDVGSGRAGDARVRVGEGRFGERVSVVRRREQVDSLAQVERSDRTAVRSRADLAVLCLVMLVLMLRDSHVVVGVLCVLRGERERARGSSVEAPRDLGVLDCLEGRDARATQVDVPGLEPVAIGITVGLRSTVRRLARDVAVGPRRRRARDTVI